MQIYFQHFFQVNPVKKMKKIFGDIKNYSYICGRKNDTQKNPIT